MPEIALDGVVIAKCQPWPAIEASCSRHKNQLRGALNEVLDALFAYSASRLETALFIYAASHRQCHSEYIAYCHKSFHGLAAVDDIHHFIDDGLKNETSGDEISCL